MRYALLPLVAVAFVGCQSGASSDAPESLPSQPPSASGASSDRTDAASDELTKLEAFRFLNQATFGATEDEAERLMRIGIERWIEDQLAQPVSLQLPYLESLGKEQTAATLQATRIDTWFRNAIHGPDQLRQRVAFALSEILVVSQNSALSDAPLALASYYDLLATYALGNYFDLLHAVTLHPAMGVYLSMLGNQKADPARNIRPDENFARELLQLFTIGLVELEINGTPKLDPHGRTIPTYTQDVIEEFARVYTGWHYTGAKNFLAARRTLENQTVPMQLYQAYHDTDGKTLFGTIQLPKNQPGQLDLAAALEAIFDHPNVGPFLSHRLIQRLVTSNPSPAYVERVARTFNDNGAGIRGDLAAVVKAILLDPEARPEVPDDTSGKLKEPLLQLTQLHRAYDGRSSTGRYNFGAIDNSLGQGPLKAPSVFNFFSPTYAPRGELTAQGLVAPELELATEFQVTMMANLLFDQAFFKSTIAQNVKVEDVIINLDEEVALAKDPAALLHRVSEKLLGGRIPAALYETILSRLEAIPENNSEIRAAEAVYLVAVSPEFAAQY